MNHINYELSQSLFALAQWTRLTPASKVFIEEAKLLEIQKEACLSCTHPLVGYVEGLNKRVGLLLERAQLCMDMNGGYIGEKL